MNDTKQSNIFNRLIGFIKENPLYSSIFIFPIVFMYLIPTFVSIGSIVIYVFLAIYTVLTGYVLYSVNKDVASDTKFRRIIFSSLIFLIFGVGRTNMLLAEVMSFDLVNALFMFNLVGVLSVNIFISTKDLMLYSNKASRTEKSLLPLTVGFSLYNLMFLLAKPVTLANETSMMYIDLIIMGIVLIVVNYLVNGISKIFMRGRFNPADSKRFVDVSGSIIAIIIGLLVGLAIMLAFNPSEAFRGFGIILQGAFYSGYVSMGDTIFYAVPIILTGLSVAFAFRTGLFNIGATGQMTIGAYFAIFIGVKWGFLGDIHPLLHWGVAVLAAALAGGIWGLIPGLLKAYRNVNEVVTTIMLNYIGMYAVTLMIKKNIYDVPYARTNAIKSTAANPTFDLDFLLPGSRLNGTIVVAVVVVIILHIILNKTTFGFELKAVGFNRDSAKYSGMNEKRNLALSLAIAGAVAGIAGAMIYLSPGKFMKPENVLLMEGFTGIAIALLGLSSPFGVLLAGLFFSSLQRGGLYMQLTGFTPEIIDIILAVIIYASALGLFLQKFVKALFGGLKFEDPQEPKVEDQVSERGDE
jgi:simple sugar transport system permease protein